jgi:hypothetical protein
MYSYTAIMKLLVAANANLEAQTHYLPGPTPLHLGALDGGAEVVMVLLEQERKSTLKLLGGTGAVHHCIWQQRKDMWKYYEFQRSAKDN